MCGCNHDDPSRTRGGALAVLSAPCRRSRSSSPSSSSSSSSSSSPPSSPSSFSSTTSTDLYFHTPGAPNARFATHMKLSSDDGLDLGEARLRVVIHTNGDMTSSNDDALYQFDIDMYAPHNNNNGLDSDFVVEMALPEQVAIEVGGVGVIGRRVSVVKTRRGGGEWAEEEDQVIGEGIVGFNF